MLFIDTLLLSPIHGVVWAARQVHNAIQQEQAAEPARITAELSDLYMMLETGRLTEAEFDAREKVLLDQLDQAQQGTATMSGEASVKAGATRRADPSPRPSPLGGERENPGQRLEQADAPGIPSDSRRSSLSPPRGEGRGEGLAGDCVSALTDRLP